VRCDELGWLVAYVRIADTCQPFAVMVVGVDPMAHAGTVGHVRVIEHLADVDGAVLAHAHGLRAVDVVPDGLQLAVLVEHLQAVVLAVGHEHILVPVDDHVVRYLELTRLAAGAAPGHNVLAIGREAVHP